MEEMNMCELCGKRARMLCESEQAKLCWDCDRTVHGANFLVAKHVRVLLCRLCHTPTPWKGSGPSLTPTSSLCQRCVLNHHDHDHDDDDDDDDDEESEEEEEEEGENQVVPWSSPSTSASVPPLPSSTNSDNDGDISSATGTSGSRFPFKRFQDNFIHESQDDVGCSSSEGLTCDESSSVRMLRPLKQPRINQREAAQWHTQRW